VLRLSVETWNDERYHATARDLSPHRTGAEESHYVPAAPVAFWSIVYGYAVIALVIGGVWLILDVKAPSSSGARKLSRSGVASSEVARPVGQGTEAADTG